MSNNLSPAGADPIVGSLDVFNKTCQQALDSGKEAVEKFKSVAVTSNWASLKATDVSLNELLKALDIYDEGFAALSNGSAITSVVKESHPEESFRTAAEQREQEIEKASTEYSLDRNLYDALQSLHQLAGDRLDDQTRHFVEKTLRDFRRSGVDKDEETRKKIKALNEELVRTGQEFSRNIRDDTRFVEVDPEDLEGLPEDYIKSHKPGDNGKIKITTDYPDYVPFVTYSRSIKAREALWRVYRKRGHPKNLEVLQRLISLRHELATILGYKSWAAYITEDKMIKTEKNAAEFIEKIANAARARRDRDYQALLDRKRQDEPDAQVVNPWEQAYLEDRIKAEKYSSDSQAVRPYFEYTRVKKGVLDTFAKLFGLSFKRLENAKVLHPDIEAYDLFGDNGRLLGRFYLDMHPREGKYKHAAQFSLVNGKAGLRLPEAVLMCNFPKPSEDPSAEPALMLHHDVETFFHEFGHLLHHILGGHTKWSGLSGVRTEWDFVETPSQLLEEWTKNASVLQTFALHYQTNEPIPTDLVKKLNVGDEFGKGIYVSQQMFYAAVSLNYYNREENTEFDTTAKLRELQEKYTTFKYVEDTYFQLSFGHLDGYSAIYYTYMWSLVIAKDLFEQFEKSGLMNTELATKYRRSILEPGGSKDAALLVSDFLGRDYSFDAYERWLNKPLE